MTGLLVVRYVLAWLVLAVVVAGCEPPRPSDTLVIGAAGWLYLLVDPVGIALFSP